MATVQATMFMHIASIYGYKLNASEVEIIVATVATFTGFTVRYVAGKVVLKFIPILRTCIDDGTLNVITTVNVFIDYLHDNQNNVERRLKISA